MTDYIEERKNSVNYGPHSPCSLCGDTIDEYSPEWTAYCHRHADERVDPFKEELRALVKKYDPEGEERAPPENLLAELESLLGEHDE